MLRLSELISKTRFPQMVIKKIEITIKKKKHRIDK